MRLPLDLDGPAPAWPAPIDAVLEWWAALPARGRVALRAALVVVVGAAATGGLLEGRWGPPTSVLVTTSDVAAGAPLLTTDVNVAERPRDLVPSDALRGSDDLPADAVADGHLPVGTVLTARAVRDGGVAGAAPPGTAVVPVPADALPALPVGARLDLAVAALDGTSQVVAHDALLVADDGTWRWLQVERGAVDAVARGVRDASLVAAVLPPRAAGTP